MAKIGIFGGTFNPVHLGHQQIVQQIKEKKGLDQILVIPTNRPPHKTAEDLVDNHHRLAMCQLVFPETEGYTVSDVEFQLGGQSYTIRTLEYLKRQYPNDQLFLIVGSDMILTFDQWKDYQKILQQVIVFAGARGENEYQAMQQKAKELMRVAGTVEIISTDILPMSSTEIRRKIKSGESCEKLLDVKVQEYIQHHHLYQTISFPELQDIVQHELTPERYHHTLCVVKKAVELAEIHHGDKQKAKLAALLHDVMKNKEPNYLLQYFLTNGIILTDIERNSPPLWHSIAGAAYIQTELQIHDQDVINAVRYHTTARKGMSLLEKIIYIADCTSEERNYDGVEVQRKLAEKNLDYAILYSLKYNLGMLIQKQKPLHPDSVQAYHDLIKKIPEVL